MPSIYLDHNATTPLLPEVWVAMQPYAQEAFGNPASAHHVGRAARRALEDSRERIAQLLGAFPDEVTFTSGATEANNLALFGLTSAAHHILASPLEHPCIREPLRILAARGVQVDWLPVTAEGIACPGAIVPSVEFATLMLANHETGAMQPVAALAQMLPATTFLHTDATQAVGKLPINFRELGVHSLSASAHKFRGPRGIGLLLVRRGTPLQPQLFGGHQQGGVRPGTEPVVLAVGMATALDHAIRHLTANNERLRAFRDRFWARLQAVAAPVVLNGPALDSPERLPTTLNVSFPGCRADLLIVALDLAGIACSTGSACSSGSLQPSPILEAMQLPDAIVRSAIRFSFGVTLQNADSDDAADRIGSAVARMRG